MDNTRTMDKNLRALGAEVTITNNEDGTLYIRANY